MCIEPECCHHTSVVTAHLDHVVGFSIFTVFQVSSLDQNVVFGPFRRSASRLLSRRFSVHRVECCEVLSHQPLLQPISSFVTLFECMRANTGTLHSVSWAQFGVEVSSHNVYAFLTGIRVLLDCSAHFLDAMVGIRRVVKVHAQKLDAMVVDRDRCSNGPLVDVFSVDDSFSPFLVQQNSNPVFVLMSSCSHVDVLLMRRFLLAGLQVSFNLHSITCSRIISSILS